MNARQLIEFYSVGVMPMDPVGDVGYADGGPGRKDDTDFDRRGGGPLDAAAIVGGISDGVMSNDDLGSERDIDADVGVPRFDHSTHRENFGMAGLPGGVRNDPESPDAYDDKVQARLAGN